MKSCILLLLITACSADIYMHTLRGCNNRLNEKSAQRKNNARLFDSQNNNRGGYNVGVVSTDPEDNHEDSDVMDEGQSQQTIYQSASNDADGPGKSIVKIQWTVQHGLGRDNEKLNGNCVIQYRLERSHAGTTHADDEDINKYMKLRNGNTIKKSKFTPLDNFNNFTVFKANVEENKFNNGMHETYFDYLSCRRRYRNKGLFHAQQVNNKKATSHRTRQNPGGNQNGFECPEERDYFPYWVPNGWIDLAYIHGPDMTQEEKDQILAASHNEKPYGICLTYLKENDQDKTDTAFMAPLKETTQELCEQDRDHLNKVQPVGIWREVYQPFEIFNDIDEADCTSPKKWGYTLLNLQEKVCFSVPPQMQFKQAVYSKENHHGNVDYTLEPLDFDWMTPHFEIIEPRIALRIRYNMSSNDYHPTNTYHDTPPQKGVDATLELPKKDDIDVDIGIRNAGEDPTTLRVNVDPNQFGRTFEDRSHVFKLEKRPTELEISSSTIHHVLVRGKRGNIAQVYPAVEYDFVPNNLKVTEDEYVFYSWEGSNTHNNGKKGGDGQTGDAGQGEKGTDRHNIVCINELNENFPVIFEKNNTLVKSVSEIYYRNTTKETKHIKEEDISDEAKIDLALELAYNGFYKNFETAKEADTVKVDADLNGSRAYFPGVLLRVKQGLYYYMCSRNNNFSNRSQKGRLEVTSAN